MDCIGDFMKKPSSNCGDCKRKLKCYEVFREKEKNGTDNYICSVRDRETCYTCG